MSSSKACGHERCVLAAHLQYRRAEGPQKAVGIARAESGTRATRDDDDRLVQVLPARLTQRTGVCGVRREFGEGDGRTAPKTSQAALNASRPGEATVEQRQPLDLSAIQCERRIANINAPERKLLQHRPEADVTRRPREPLAGRLIDGRSGAMESLARVSVNECGDALLHVLEARSVRSA